MIAAIATTPMTTAGTSQRGLLGSWALRTSDCVAALCTSGGHTGSLGVRASNRAINANPEPAM